MGQGRGQGTAVLYLGMNPKRLHFLDDDVVSAAVAVTLVHGGEHAAMAYRSVRGELKLLHLFIDGQIGTGDRSAKYLLVIPNLLASSLLSLAGLCESLHERRDILKIYYDFGADAKARFEVAENRCELITGEPSAGLSCSTFVVALFSSINRPLVKVRTWKHRPSDLARHLSLIQMLQDNGQEVRAAQLASRVGRIRISPCEVAGAATEEKIPASFATCCVNAEIINDVLIQMRSSPPDAILGSVRCSLDRNRRSGLSRGLVARWGRLWAPAAKVISDWWIRHAN